MTRQSNIDLLPRVEDRLTTASAESLLQTFAALTHRIHEAEQWKSGDGVPPDARDLRRQRDMVKAECLRRMGGEA